MAHMKPIQFAELTSEEAVIQPDGYRCFEPKKWPWISKLLWRFLHKLGALEPYYVTYKTYTYGEAEQKAVTEAVMHHAEALMENGLNLKDYSVIMGAKQFHELTAIMVRQSGSAFPAADICHHDHGSMRRLGVPREYHHQYRATLRGLPVNVVPHMDGTALVPRVLVEKSQST